MDGLEATRCIRELEAREQWRRPCCIILVSASSFSNPLAMQAGCNHVLPKPLFAEDVLRIVRLRNESYKSRSGGLIPSPSLSNLK